VVCPQCCRRFRCVCKRESCHSFFYTIKTFNWFRTCHRCQSL